MLGARSGLRMSAACSLVTTRSMPSRHGARARDHDPSPATTVTDFADVQTINKNAAVVGATIGHPTASSNWQDTRFAEARMQVRIPRPWAMSRDSEGDGACCEPTLTPTARRSGRLMIAVTSRSLSQSRDDS